MELDLLVQRLIEIIAMKKAIEEIPR